MIAGFHSLGISTVFKHSEKQLVRSSRKTSEAYLMGLMEIPSGPEERLFFTPLREFLTSSVDILSNCEMFSIDVDFLFKVY